MRIFAATLLASFVASSAWAEGAIRVDARQAALMGVVTQTLGAAQTTAEFRLPGRVVLAPGRDRLVAAPLPGLVENLVAAVDERVRRGQVLARLSSPMLVEAQRAYLEAHAQAELAQANFRRDEALWQEGIIAESRYAASRAAYLGARAVMNERAALLELYGLGRAARERLAASGEPSPQLVLTAPVDGVVLERMASVGAQVEAAQPLYRLASLDRLELELAATPEVARMLAPGAPVEVTGGRGRILRIGTTVDASGNVTVRAALTQLTGALLPGQYLEARVRRKTGAAGFYLPQAGLVRRGGQHYVFVADARGFRAVPVTVLAQGAGQAIVTGPLAAGERVVVKGAAALKAVWTGVGEE